MSGEISQVPGQRGRGRAFGPVARIRVAEGPMAEPTDGESLKRTPLYARHVARGARMVPFSGYEMPVQYRSGIIAEHNHTRAAAGLFDVSHMGQGYVVGPNTETTA